MKPDVMIITSVHRWDDTRIFHREARALARKYAVELHAPAAFDSREIDGVRIVGLPRWKRERDRLRSWAILLKRVLCSGARVIHFHDPELVPLAFMARILSGKKAVYDVHEHYVHDIMDKGWIPRRLRRAVTGAFILTEKICVPRFDGVIYTTPVVGERYRDMGKRLVSIENYPDVDVFDLSGDMMEDYRLVYLGRVKKERGLKEAVRAFEKVKARFPGALFDIVGDIVPSSYEDELRDLVGRLGLQDSIIFHGFVPYPETVGYLRKASCGIVTFLPANNNMACLPNKLFEYMAAGLPVVASDFELYREVVRGSECGLTVDATDPDSIADAVIRVFDDPAEAARMGKRGQTAFREKYNWQKEEKKLLDLYGELLPTGVRAPDSLA